MAFQLLKKQKQVDIKGLSCMIESSRKFGKTSYFNLIIGYVNNKTRFRSS